MEFSLPAPEDSRKKYRARFAVYRICGSLLLISRRPSPSVCPTDLGLSRLPCRHAGGHTHTHTHTHPHTHPHDKRHANKYRQRHGEHGYDRTLGIRLPHAPLKHRDISFVGKPHPGFHTGNNRHGRAVCGGWGLASGLLLGKAQKRHPRMNTGWWCLWNPRHPVAQLNVLPGPMTRLTIINQRFAPWTKPVQGDTHTHTDTVQADHDRRQQQQRQRQRQVRQRLGPTDTPRCRRHERGGVGLVYVGCADGGLWLTMLLRLWLALVCSD